MSLKRCLRSAGAAALQSGGSQQLGRGGAVDRLAGEEAGVASEDEACRRGTRNGGLNSYQYHFEADLWYSRLYPKQEYGATILAAIEVSTVLEATPGPFKGYPVVSGRRLVRKKCCF